jgi:N-acetylglucosamine kinase-like BadF-type ATPase
LLVWAVDAGGTKTQGILADESGRVWAHALAGPCNLSNQGVEGCAEVLSELLGTMTQQAQVDKGDVTHAYLALGGLDTEKDREDLAGVVGRLFAGCATEWYVENDVLAALFSGTKGEPGVVLLAGTGSMAMGLDGRGRLARAGGWGFLISGDPGSASSVGQRLMSRILDDYDAGLGPSDLTQRVLQSVGRQTPPELVDWIEEHPSPSTRLAHLARLVGDAASGGDPVARRILGEAAEQLVRQFLLLLDRLDYDQAGSVPVVLAGGLFGSTYYQAAVRRLVAGMGPRWRCVVPAVPPVGGAFVGALRASGRAISDEVLKRLAEGMDGTTYQGGV